MNDYKKSGFVSPSRQGDKSMRVSIVAAIAAFAWTQAAAQPPPTPAPQSPQPRFEEVARFKSDMARGHRGRR
jgi:hypothetical protein